MFMNRLRSQHRRNKGAGARSKTYDSSTDWLLTQPNEKPLYDLRDNNEQMPDLEASFCSIDTDSSSTSSTYYFDDNVSCASSSNNSSARVSFLLPAKKPQPPVMLKTRAKRSSSLLKGHIPMVKVQPFERSTSDRLWVVGTMPDDNVVESFPFDEVDRVTAPASDSAEDAPAKTEAYSESCSAWDVEVTFQGFVDYLQSKASEDFNEKTAPSQGEDRAVPERVGSFDTSSIEDDDTIEHENPNSSPSWILTEDSVVNSLLTDDSKFKPKKGQRSFIEADNLESLVSDILGYEIPSDVKLVRKTEQHAPFDEARDAARAFDASFQAQEDKEAEQEVIIDGSESQDDDVQEVFNSRSRSESLTEEKTTTSLQVVINGESFDEPTFRFVVMLVLLQLAFLKVAASCGDMEQKLLQIRP